MINEEKEDVKRGRKKKAGNKAKICAKNLMEKKKSNKEIFFESEKLKEEEEER